MPNLIALQKKLYELKRPNYIVIFGLLLGNFGVHRYYNGDKKVALYFLVPFVAVLLFLIFGAPEQIEGIGMWIWIAALIDANILARKTSAKNYEEIRKMLGA